MGVLGPGRIGVRGSSHGLKPLGDKEAADILRDAESRGINNLKFCFKNLDRGEAGSFKLILEFSGGRGYRLISCLRDYLRLLQQISNVQANVLIGMEIMSHAKRGHIYNRQSSRENRFQEYYWVLSHDHLLSKYNFYKRLTVSEKTLRHKDVLAENEKMPAKRTVYRWVDKWQLIHNERKLDDDHKTWFDNHKDIAKRSRSIFYKKTKKESTD